MKEFTEKELAKKSGKNGNTSYVSYNGKVCNVSNSFFGKMGTIKFFMMLG